MQEKEEPEKMEEEYMKKINQALHNADLKKLKLIFSFLKGIGLV